MLWHDDLCNNLGYLYAQSALTLHVVVVINYSEPDIMLGLLSYADLIR